MSTTRLFSIGVDIGQKVDHSAICLIEIVENKVIVRALVKFNLGTPWNLLMDAVIDLAKSIMEKGDIYSFNVDATGVGAVPAQMIQEKLPDFRVDSFIFTNKSKRELVGKVKILHALGRLKFAMRKGDEIYNRTIHELIVEMKQLQARVIRDDITNPEIEVFRTGSHDDLFTALALAIKDVDLNVDYDMAVAFVEDKTWVRTPLDELKQPSVILF